MSKMLIALTVLICMNILLYLGGFRVFEGDILSRFYRISEDNTIEGFTSGFNDTLPKDILIVGQSEGGLEATPADFRVVSIFRMIFGLFKFLFNIMFAPVAIFTSPQLNLPMEIQFMLGLPFGIIMFFLALGWYRQGSD